MRAWLRLFPCRSVWLDVDELDDLNKLEEYVHRSALLLAFLSQGYFLSRSAAAPPPPAPSRTASLAMARTRAAGCAPMHDPAYAP